MTDFPIQPDRPAIEVIDPLTLHGVAVPERRWLVEGWIPWRQVTSLYGDGGTGKSLLALQLMTSTVLGRPWLGRAVTPVRALGFFCEDDADELHRRQDAVNRAYKIEFGDLEDMAWISRVGHDNVLMAFEHDGRGELTPLYFEILAEAKERGAQLVVIDTAADVFSGNENIKGQARQFISVALGRMAQEIDGVVVLCAHPSLSGLRSGEGTSGNTAWSNTVRSRLYLSRLEGDDDAEPDNDARILSRRKANYAGIGDEIRLRWSDGVFEVEGSSEVSANNDKLAWIERGTAADAAEAAFLACLSLALEQGRRISDSAQAANYGPKLFLQFPAGKTFRRNDLKWAMERLFAAGKIRVQDTGSASKPARQIVPIEVDTESTGSPVSP